VAAAVQAAPEATAVSTEEMVAQVVPVVPAEVLAF
jgi:hypothetical protein